LIKYNSIHSNIHDISKHRIGWYDSFQVNKRVGVCQDSIKSNSIIKMQKLQQDEKHRLKRFGRGRRRTVVGWWWAAMRG